MRLVLAERKYHFTAKNCIDGSTTTRRIATISQHLKVDGRCAPCEVGNGLPIANGKGRSYYISRHDGRRMLVVERRSGECLRINGTIQVVILEIHPDVVKFAIECLPDEDAKPQDNRGLAPSLPLE